MSSENTSLAKIFTVCLVVGVAMLVTVLSLYQEPEDPGAAERQVTAEYGYQLLRHTAAIMGPENENPEMRYSGTNMACASCHLDTG